MSKYSIKNLSLVNVTFLLITPVILVLSFIYLLNTAQLSWPIIIISVISYFVSGLSITVGYHRLFAHKTFEANFIIKLLLAIFGATAFQNSILKWASDHRIHHSKVDTQDDPYSINEGFFYAHIGWIFLKKNSEIKERFAKDLRKDKLIMWQHNHYLFIASFFGIILPIVGFGYIFESYIVGVFMVMFRIVLVHHCTFFINSLCHYVGTTPYTNENTAKDSWIMAFLSFGEGYHNFHHYFQTDYRNGVRWYQFDPTKWIIKSMSYIGATRNLKKTPKQRIIEAKLSMELNHIKRLLISEQTYNELEKLKSNIVETMKKIEDIKLDIKKVKHQKQKALSNISINDLKIRIKKSKFELEQFMEQWRLLTC